MRDITVIVPGRAVPWKAPRVVRRGATVVGVKPAATASWQAVVRLAAAEAAAGSEPMTGAVRLWLYVASDIPRSWSKKKRADALEGRLRPTSRPDLTNVLKAVEDACNGVLYLDDSQVVEHRTCRMYTAGAPSVTIRVEAL